MIPNAKYARLNLRNPDFNRSRDLVIVYAAGAGFDRREITVVLLNRFASPSYGAEDSRVERGKQYQLFGCAA